MIRFGRSTRRKKRQRQPHSSRQKGQRSRKTSGSKKTERRAYESQTIPPVMVRGSVLGTTLESRTRRKPRRRYDVALNVPGAEMRLPSLPQVAFGMRIVSGLVLLALSIIFYQMWNSPIFRVESAEIIGLKRLNLQDVNAVLGIMDEMVFAIDPVRLQQILTESFPEFSSVSIQVQLPNIVEISVNERQPIITWHQNGRTLLVDSDGFAFPLRNNTDPLPTPIVNAMNFPEIIQQEQEMGSKDRLISIEMVSAILSLGSNAPEGITLIYDNQRGLGWSDHRGWDVYFGDVRSIDMKLRVYETLVEHFEEEGITPAIVSVEHVHAPYYRMER